MNVQTRQGSPVDSPDTADAVLVEQRFARYERQVAPQRLRNEHPVEGVAMGAGQSSRVCSVFNGDGQLFKALVGNGSGDVVRKGFGARKLAETMLGGNLPADAALISMSFDSSPMARRAMTGSRSLPASHHMNA